MTVSVTSLHPLFAARVGGLDLRRDIPAADMARVQRAIDERGVLVFPGLPLEQEQQLAFARRFGALETSGILAAARPRVHEKLADVSNLDADGRVLAADDRKRMSNLANMIWHTDSSFKATPAKYSLLHTHAVPPTGGETEFADMRAAYEALPAAMKARVDDLVVVHSIFTSRAKIGFTEFTDAERARLPPVRQRLVRTHPVTGAKSLYLASHADHIVGWPVPDGKMLLLDLMEHATQRDFVYAHRWAVGDLVMWDNRCTMHRGRPFDPAHRRDMRRATVEDDGPTVAQVAA